MDFAAYRDKDPDYRSATRDVARLVDELVDEGVDGLVVDLRGNGGGSLMEARELAGLFLGPGPVVQIRDAAGRVQVLSNDAPARYEGPLAVLVDRISASASEIFAGAVQDRGRGLVLGARTFGKGTVQEILPLAEGQLKLTHSKFYRASGGSTQNRGVLPDLPFPPTYDAEVIGESALDDALPWDSIEAVVSPPGDGLAEVLAGLLSRHQTRVDEDADFRRAAELLAFREERRQETRVSLSQEARQRRLDEIEAAHDAIQERWREAKGEPAPEEDGEPDEEELRQSATARMLNPHRATADAYQREACEVLADLIETGATLPEDPWMRAPGAERGGN
jgi:carboxyl-terminal processing protease